MMRPNSLLLAAALAACAGAESRSIDDATLVSEPSGENWSGDGREYRKTHEELHGAGTSLS